MEWRNFSKHRSLSVWKRNKWSTICAPLNSQEARGSILDPQCLSKEKRSLQYSITLGARLSVKNIINKKRKPSQGLKNINSCRCAPAYIHLKKKRICYILHIATNVDVREIIIRPSFIVDSKLKSWYLDDILLCVR